MALRHDVISTLSHGFKQRVGIAQAVVHGPDLVVLDEPIAGLDPVQIVEMRELVRNLRDDHTTIISSHILSEISETCDRILVIRDGEIVASGTEAELSSRLLEGAQIVVTVRGDAAAARRLIHSMKGVRGIEHVAGANAGADLTTFHVDAERDLREEICRTLVLGNLGVVEITRSERELESIFLRLANPQAAGQDGAAPVVKEAS